jgi:hypothetical protein
VDRAGDEFLARTGLAGDQDGGAGRRDAFDQVEHPLHGRGPADNASAHAISRIAAELGDFAAQRGLLQRPLQREEQLLRAERLVDVIERAQLHGLDGIVDGAERRHDDELRVRLQSRRRAEHVHAVHTRQVQVEQHQVVEFTIEGLQCVLAGGDCVHGVAFLPQQPREQLPHDLLVLHDEDAAAR